MRGDGADEDRGGDDEGDHDRDVDDEDPAPAQGVDQHPAEDHARRAAEAGQAAPDAHGDVASLAVFEGDGEDAQGGRGQQCATEALDGPRGDQQSW